MIQNKSLICKMTAKKRWTTSIQTESQELIDKISWNSSSSEESEDESRNPKKFKPYFPKFDHTSRLPVISPIKVAKICAKKRDEPISSKENDNEVKDLKNKQYFPKFDHDMKLPVINPINITKICGMNRGKEPAEIDSTESIDISTFTSEEKVFDRGSVSPILEQKINIACLPKSDSPIISQNYLFRETSPVLTNRETIRRKKREIIDRCSKIDESSPDIFLSKCSDAIEECESPDRITIATTNCSENMGTIESISSQDGSSLVIVNPSISESSIKTSDLSNQCYHQPSPRRKNCKKNGLLYQLQKALDLRKSRLSLWHHDIFCKNIIPSDLEHIRGIINRKWKDFGCIIMKCYTDNKDSSESDVFLVSLGCNTDANLVYNSGQIIKLFPPFEEKLVQFENREVKIYYNVSKILTELTSENVSS